MVEHGDIFLNDLLPVPYNDESLDRICCHIDQVQEALGLRMLLENPSAYVALEATTMTEVEFLREIVRRTGCGLLLDLNNLYVSAINQEFDPLRCVGQFPLEHVEEIHLGGFAEQADDRDGPLLIDDHGSEVAEPVWSLYRETLARTGPVPTMVEWDNNVPAFAVLAGEAARAKSVLRDEANRPPRRVAA